MLAARATEDTAQHAAKDLPADLAADRARGLLGHGFDHALAPRGAPQEIAQDPAVRFGLLPRLSRSSAAEPAGSPWRSAASGSRTPTRG